MFNNDLKPNYFYGTINFLLSFCQNSLGIVAICYGFETFTYLQVSFYSWVFAELVLACDQHILLDVFAQTFHAVYRQVEINGEADV